MVGHGNQGEGAGSGMVGQSGYINQKLVAGSACHKLPAESAETYFGYVIIAHITHAVVNQIVRAEKASGCKS